jgi:polar amino acid transport system permease protein
VPQYTWDFSVVWENLGLLLAGLRTTVMLAVLAFALGLVLGLVAALGRMSRFRTIRALSGAYVEFFRTTPLLAQLWWIYYVIPFTTGLVVPRLGTAIIAFGLNLGAFLCEIYRAGIMSISRNQRNAALALGMTPTQAMRRVILPQAVSRVVPPMGSMWVSLFKDTAIVFVIAVPELMHAAREVAVETYRPLEILTVTALIYFIVTYPQARGVDFLHRKFRVVE